MQDIITTFGKYICDHTADHPDRSRRLLKAAYVANGLGIRVAPERKLSPALRYGVNYINDAVVQMLRHPQKAALVNVFMPCELLHAMEITPMCAEMYSSYINGTKCESVFAEKAEAEGIAETFCSYHKVLVGSAYADVLPKPALIANCSLVCDANNLTFRALSEHFEIPRYYIEVPQERSEDSVAYVADQFREMKNILEEYSGKRLEEEKLKAAVERSRQTIELLRACRAEKRRHSLPGKVVTELNEIYMTHNGLGTPQALRYGELLYKDLQQAPPAHGIRLLWLYAIPIWQPPVKELLDLNEHCQLVACDMNLDALVDQDPEHPYESMAGRLVYSGLNGAEARVRMALENAEILQVDGVVFFCNWGCKQSMGLSVLVKDALEEAGFPTLILNGDACDRRNASDGQVSTRLGAFVEMLEKNK